MVRWTMFRVQSSAMCLRIMLLLACLLSIAAPLVAAPAQFSGQGAAATLLLAKNGRPAMPVIVSPNASDATKAIAAELAGYLRQMAGAPFEIKTGDGSAGIILGTLAEFPDPALQEPLRVRDGFDGSEAYAIRSEPGRLRLIGATDLGASHAAFRLLESLGCRWFFPGKTWEVVPHRPELSAGLNEVSRPAILARRIWYGYGFFPDDASKAGAGRDARSQADYRAWARHNRMASSFTVSAGHAWQSIILHNRAVFDAHPEYLALVKGKRQGEQLCVSNPNVRELAIAYAREYLNRNPAADMVSMECSDGDGHCECDDCRKLGSISDRVFGLANDVARMVAREFPGKMVGVLAYNQHCEPPGFALEPNVYVQLTHGFIRGRYTFDELADLWPATCRRMGFYEYFSVYLWDHDMLPGGVGANIAALRSSIAAHGAHGATSVDAESGDNWGLHGRGYYVANKLMWDPKADVGAILDDFYHQAFGPGAAAMKRYYERFDPGNEPLMSEPLLAEGFRDVQEAATLAKDRPDVQARLNDLKHYLRFVQLTWDLQREKDKENRKAATIAVLRLVCRTRFSYMNHWQALRHELASKAAKEFGEPTWVLNDPSPKPWTNDREYTAEETEKEFQEGLARFRPEPVEQLTFSQDLVPVRFADAPQKESDQRYQGPGRYALYSLRGEPLAMEIRTGIIAWYRDRAAARYTITDAAGAGVAQGRLPQDGEIHALEIKVPRAGLYYLDFDDASAGWGVKVAAGKPCAIILPRGRAMSHMGHMQTMYFYVPRGTRQIRYYWLGGAHNIHGPGGRPVIDVSSSGRFVSIPVPEGEDGKPWSFSQLALGHLWFFNAPNMLAASPDALLIPRELSQKDHLTPNP
ncbi:MAG: DUF4838 domain-containing protein [Tepidisphaerales bacterium]